MAKRFTDSEKWKKPFIRSIETPYKLLWLYVLDECDHAGIWQVDIEVAQLKIGESFTIEDALRNFKGKIISFSNNEKWLIIDFIDFQYGVLNPKNRVHESVITQLSKYDLIDESLKIKPLTSPLQTAKDKDKDKDKEEDKDKATRIFKKLITDESFLNNTCLGFRLPWNKETNHNWLIERLKDWLHLKISGAGFENRTDDEIKEYFINQTRKIVLTDPEIIKFKNVNSK